jgi:hypothetical protein
MPKGKMIRRRRPTKEVFIEDVAEAASISYITTPSVINDKEIVKLNAAYKAACDVTKRSILTFLNYLKTLQKSIHNTSNLILQVTNLPLFDLTHKLFPVSASLEVKNLVLYKRELIWEFIQNDTCLRITTRIVRQMRGGAIEYI